MLPVHSGLEPLQDKPEQKQKALGKQLNCIGKLNR